jgi:hypothetical protein
LTVDHDCKKRKRERGLLSLPFAETVFSVMCQVQHRRHCLQTISDISKQRWLALSFRELSNVAFSDHSITCQHSESYNEVASTLETAAQRAFRGYNTDMILGYYSHPSQGDIKSLVLCHNADHSLKGTTLIP